MTITVLNNTNTLSQSSVIASLTNFNGWPYGLYNVIYNAVTSNYNYSQNVTIGSVQYNVILKATYTAGYGSFGYNSYKNYLR